MNNQRCAIENQRQVREVSQAYLPPETSDPRPVLAAPGQVKAMLSQYRSRDIQRATEAAEWFVAIDVKQTIDELIQELGTDNPNRRMEVQETLVAYGEIALKPVMNLLDDPERYSDAVEILALMDGYVVHHMIRQLKKALSFNRMVGTLKALAGHLENPNAVAALCAGLRDPDPLIQTYIGQTLLESGPRGHRILKQVFPAEAAIAA